MFDKMGEGALLVGLGVGGWGFEEGGVKFGGEAQGGVGGGLKGGHWGLDQGVLWCGGVGFEILATSTLIIWGSRLCRVFYDTPFLYFFIFGRK
jgi:hypothetical protein